MEYIATFIIGSAICVIIEWIGDHTG